MNETVLKAVSELIKQGIHPVDILKTLVRTRVDENFERINKYKYVVLTDYCKICLFGYDEYIFFQGEDVYKYEYLTNELSEPNVADIANIMATKYLESVCSEFDAKIWKKHFASAYSIADIERADEKNFNVIVKDGYVEQDLLDTLAIRYKEKVTLELHNGVDYWLFEFANR